MTDHPTPEELAAFVWNRMNAAQARDVVAHLVSGCEPCRAGAALHLDGRMGIEEPPEPVLSRAEEDEYDVALDRAFATVLRVMAERREAEKREALAYLTAAKPEEYPEIPDHLKGLPLFDALIERSLALRHESAEEMLRLAEWALLMADKAEFPFQGPAQRSDLRCRAWIEVGNAHRVADDLPEAVNALGRATCFFLEGTQDEALGARLLDIQASLFGSLRNFESADRAMNAVFVIQRRLGNRHSAGRALIKKGVYVGYAGNAEEAVRLIGEGMALLDKGRDPLLEFLSCHNQARFLLDCGRLRDARMAVIKLRSRGLDPGGRINELKVRWLEAQILVATGALESAEGVLQEVKQGFEKEGLGYKAALAALELGAVKLREGNTGAAETEVVQAADVFIAVGVRREARVSVLLLKEAFERKRVNVELLDRVIRFLHRADQASEAQLEPSQD